PTAASARFLLASLYMTQGNNDSAASILKQVVELQPRDALSAQLLAVLTSRGGPEQGQAGAAEPPAGAADPPAGAAEPPAGSPPSAPDQPPAAQAPNDANPASGPSLPTNPVPTKLVGTWTAAPAKDVTISLVLGDDKSFTWSVSDRGQSRQFRGQAT